jgi:hypothetical protein
MPGMKDDPTSGNGTLIKVDSFPSVHIDPRMILVWLPPGYDSTKAYPVLYMQDGQMLFDSTITWTQQEWKVDETMSRLILRDSIRSAIVVGIPNNGLLRWSEYVPQAILDSLPVETRALVIRRWLQDNPLSNRYLKFIVTELKPYIDEHYSTLPDPTNTFLVGSSMGAIISLYGMCEYPDVFGGAACLSTHWPLNIPGLEDPDIRIDVPATFRNYLKAHLPPPAGHRLYFDYGSATLDSLYKPYQVMVDSVVLKKGYTADNWMTMEFPGEDHTERAWAKRLHIPIQFLLGR